MQVIQTKPKLNKSSKHLSQTDRLLLAGTLGLFIITLLFGGIAASTKAKADASTTDEINITVSVSCSLSASVDTAHAAEINNGTYRADIGTTTLKAFCNDAEGFAIYAIGYTDDEEGNNVLINSSLSNTYDIVTGTATSGGISNWAMKLATNSEATYPITLQNGYNSYSAVPNDYTLVASRASNTDTGDNATGSLLTTTYAAYISQTQPAGTYEGQVKYVLVRPNDTDAPVRYDQVAVNYNGNGLTFADGSSTNKVVYSESCTTTNYDYEESMSSNILTGGTQDGAYTNSEYILDEITISGAAKLKVVVSYALTANTAGIEIVEGSWDGDWGNLSGTYYELYDGSNDISGTETYIIDGDTATIYMDSWDTPTSGYDYGYYAKIYPLDENDDEYTSPKTICGYTSISGTYAETTDWKGYWHTAVNGNIIELVNEDGIIDYIEENAESLLGTTITVYASTFTEAVLDTGQNVNAKLKTLAGNSSATHSTEDAYIAAIERSDTLPSGFATSTDNIISVSTIPVYAWFDDDTIYYYSTADTIYLNSDAICMFFNMRKLSDGSDLAYLDASNVTNMSNMFRYTGYNAATFTLDLTDWDVSSVTDMSAMFSTAGHNATTWSIGDLSGWDVSNVTNMGCSIVNDDYDYCGIFHGTGYSVTTWSVGDLSNWDTSNVTDMSEMFATAGYSATTFDISYISNWDTSSVTKMDGMFAAAGHNATTWSIGDLSDWDTSNVTTMSYMFSGAGYSATVFDISYITGWNTSNVTNMSCMFQNAGHSATTFALDLSSWDTSSVWNMSCMFLSTGYNVTTFYLNLSNWDTSNVTDMYQMFYYAGPNAASWSVIIPQTNGNGISNTTSTLYGRTTSIRDYASSAGAGRTFTLASGS